MTLEKTDSVVTAEQLPRTASSLHKTSSSRLGGEAEQLHEGEGEGEGEHCEEEGPEVEQLLPDTNIVTHCIYKNDPKRLIQCFEDDQDPFKDEVMELLNERGDDGKSPLDICACLGRNQLTQELIQRGADVNSFTKKGYSALHYAAIWGRLPAVKLLIEAGADLQQRNINGERPREAGMRYNQDECVDYLDWAEAKAMLQESIRFTLETVTDVDKAVAGRITKEEKTITMNTCKEKQEWLDTTEDATTEDFIAQRVALLDVVGLVVQKLTEPPPEL